MIEYVKTIIAGQFEAALGMMNDCIAKCPLEHWSGPTSLIGKYEFWHVAYHMLCFVDLYLSPDEKAFAMRPDLHPKGWSEFDDEHPSRRFERGEIIQYVEICRRKLLEAIAAETQQSLEGPSGHSGRSFSRGELHIYNMRHVQHHTGQLSAFLRRTTPRQDPRWVGSGWRDT